MIRPFRRSVPETYFERRFGIPRRELSGYRFFTSGKGRSVWISSRGLELPQRVEPEFVGMRCLRLDANSKPTSAFLRRFGDLCRRGVVEMDAGEARAFLEGGEFAADTGVGSGFVACSFRGDVLGCGLYEDGVVRSRLPKGMRREVSRLKL